MNGPRPPDRRRHRRLAAAVTGGTAALLLAGCTSAGTVSGPGPGSAPSSTMSIRPTAPGNVAPTARLPGPGVTLAPSRSGIPSATALPPGQAQLLRFEDPPHTEVQPFPPAGTCAARGAPGGVLPDRACTPGALDRHVTQANLASTVCRPGGYTKSVRPPVAVTRVEKRAALVAYGDTGPSSNYELDHLVPLSLGGSPNSPANLWPQPGSAPNAKDKLEGALLDLVCSDRMPLAEAQQAIATDWVTAYRQVLGRDPAQTTP